MRPLRVEDIERQPWRQCPWCGILHDGMTGVSDDGHVIHPKDGDPLICSNCGSWGVLDSTVEGGWRKPTFSENVEMSADHVFQRTLWAARVIRDRRAESR